MADNKINVGGRLHSIATGNILAGADEILDDNKGKKQSEINTDVDNALTDRYTKDETYNKNELNSLITTPDVQYITVIATGQTTVVTDILPSVGATNTIYRVGKWDGTQYSTVVYSEYAWDGSAYVLLNVKEYGIDDEPTAGSDNLVKSGGVFENITKLEVEINGIHDGETYDPSSLPTDGMYDIGGHWAINNGYQDGSHIACEGGATYKITASSVANTMVSFVKSLPTTTGESVIYATGESGRRKIDIGTSQEIVVPNDAAFIWFGRSSYGNNTTPVLIEKLGQDIDGLVDKIGKLEQNTDGLVDNLNYLSKSVAAEWQPNTAYIIGDVVAYNYTRYKCITSHTSTTIFSENNWEEESIQQCIDKIIGERTIGNVLPTSIFEYGSLSNGKLTEPILEYKFFKNKRTKNYLSLDKFSFTPVANTVVYVNEYDNVFNFLRKVEVSNTYSKPSGVSYIKIEISSTDTSNEVSMTLEQGGINTEGEEITNPNRVRTDYIEINNFEDVWFENYVFTRVYDSSKNIITTFGQQYGPIFTKFDITNRLTTAQLSQAVYVRIVFGADSEISPSSVHARMIASNDIITVPNFNIDDFGEIKNGRDKTTTIEFLYNAHPSSGTDILSSSSETRYDVKLYVNSGRLLLPPSYNRKGLPTPLIFMAHGSNDYTQFTGQEITTLYSTYYDYWLKEGYAIFDVWPMSSKYGTHSSNSQGTPSSVAMFEQGYKWLIEHYNIESDGCYVSCKSLGGMIAFASLYSNVKIKAADLLAPMINPNDRQLGWAFSDKRIYIIDTNMDNADSLLDLNYSQGQVLPQEDFKAILIGNEEKLAGWNAYYQFVVNKTYSELLSLDYTVADTWNGVRKLVDVPVRIHVALDDVNIYVNEIINLITALKNGGSKAELRIMPTGTGGHHSVDNGENAPKVASITTLNGDVCVDVPLAYVEVIDWFRQFS